MSGVEHFHHRDGALLAVALLEVVALQQPGHGVAAGEAHELVDGHGPEPLAVEADDGLVRVQQLEDLALVGLGVGQHLVLGQGLAGLGLAAGVADHAREVADEEDHRVAEALEGAQLVDHHRVADVQVRGAGVGAELHHQRLPRGPGTLQLLLQLARGQRLVGAAEQLGQLLLDRGERARRVTAHRWFLSFMTRAMSRWASRLATSWRLSAWRLPCTRARRHFTRCFFQ
jgi:hypothetical protein